MFGLDARIALAIFGVLSVISGAALYGAIQDAKVTALVTEIKEVEKAFEAYYLDTGQFPPLYSTGYGNAYDFQNFLTNDAGIDGWEGPYLSNNYILADQNFVYSNGYKGLLANFEHGDWGAGSAGVDISCAVADLCSVFIEINKPGLSIANAIAMKIDGDLDEKRGSIRFHPDLTDPSLYYRTNISYTRK